MEASRSRSHPAARPRILCGTAGTSVRVPLRLMLILAALLSAGHAYPVTPLTVQQLRDICTLPEALQEPDACDLYLRGFLDGAIATDERVVNNVARELEGASYRERAYRTRLGPRLEHYGPAYYADLCIDASVPLSELRKTVVTALQEDADAAGPAREYVYNRLRVSYPCLPDEQR